jgi:hypothetical protein
MSRGANQCRSGAPCRAISGPLTSVIKGVSRLLAGPSIRRSGYVQRQIPQIPKLIVCRVRRITGLAQRKEAYVSNSEVERIAIEHVMGLERVAGREPEDVRSRGLAYDIASPPRKIEVKAFGGSARGAPIPLEERQVQAARDDPGNYYLYVVDNVAGGQQAIAVRVLHGAFLREMLDRAVPHITYWPTFRTGDYDQIKEGLA